VPNSNTRQRAIPKDGYKGVPAWVSRQHGRVLRTRATLKRPRGDILDALRLATYSAAVPLPRGFVPPCLPTKAPQPPSGDTWLHEIKHDGFRVIARKDGERVRLYSRPGNDLTYRFTLIVDALARLRFALL
jgi:bifunctional non-homologous end joining protein LigD